MDLIQRENFIKRVIAQNDFIAVLKQTEKSRKPYFDELLKLPWQDYQNTLTHFIIEFFNGLKNNRDIFTHSAIPADGLKGVYFCLGDDGVAFDMGGSLYFNESDWAANATFDFGYNSELEDLLFKIEAVLMLLKSNHDDEITYDEITDIFYLFDVFTLFKALEKVENIAEVKNAGIAIGYSEGDELILGYFSEGKFVKDIKIVWNGEHENPSSAPSDPSVDPAFRGPLWGYLQHNYHEFLKAQNRYEQFVCDGEKLAEKIIEEFKDYIFINRCEKCGHIKKTSKAKLCLNCGAVIDPKAPIQD